MSTLNYYLLLNVFIQHKYVTKTYQAKISADVWIDMAFTSPSANQCDEDVFLRTSNNRMLPCELQQML